MDGANGAGSGGGNPRCVEAVDDGQCLEEPAEARYPRVGCRCRNRYDVGSCRAVGVHFPVFRGLTFRCRYGAQGTGRIVHVRGIYIYCLLGVIYVFSLSTDVTLGGASEFGFISSFSIFKGVALFP